MKRLVNGREEELSDGPLSISRLEDRLLVHTNQGTYSAVVIGQGDEVLVSYKGRQFVVAKPGLPASQIAAQASGELRAPMPGTVVAVHVREGDSVKFGTTILVLEAMKTQQPFVAPFDGIVEKLPVAVGSTVSEGALLGFLSPGADTLKRVSE